MKIHFLLLLAGLAGTGMAPAQAQFIGYPFIYHHHRAATQDSAAVHKPFQAGRGGAFVGLMGLRDRSGTTFLGIDLEASYFLAARWRSGLRGTRTRPSRVPALPLGLYEGLARPQADVFSLTWSNALLLLDRPHWRMEALAGVGAGWRNLRDEDQQVPARGGLRWYGRSTRGKVLDTTWNPLTEVGLMATYKPRAAAPWLSVRGQYRHWYGNVPFGDPGQFSHYLLSVGMSLPSAPPGGASPGRLLRRTSSSQPGCSLLPGNEGG